MSNRSGTLAPDALKRLLAGYAPHTGVADELMREDGTLRPVWQPLVQHLAALSPEARARSFARGDQYLHDAGVYFRQNTGLSRPSGTGRSAMFR